MKTTVRAAAKINLFLDVTGRLDNGYHTLFSVMQSVGIYDEISVEITDSKKIELSCTEKSIPCNEKNTAYKAAASFFETVGIENPGVKIEISKNIPFCAGLAGGSADAAGVIRALDKIFETNADDFLLIDIAKKVGSDVMFCLFGGTKLIQNMGDVITPLPALADCVILLAKPASGVSTKGAYESYDKAPYIYRPDSIKFLDAAARSDFEGICHNAGNVFEQVVEVFERVDIRSAMLRHGALLSQMSGSGPTVFGIFKDEKAAKECAADLEKLCKNVFVTRPVNSGVEF